MSAPPPAPAPMPPWPVRVAAAVRPATLWAALAPVVTGCALAAADGNWVLWPGLASLGVALCLQLATNLFNDWADFGRGADAADRLGPARAMQRGWASARALLGGTGLALAGAGICGGSLIATGGWPVVAIGVASGAAALAYSGGPYPLAYHGLGEVAVFAFFGPVAVAGTYYVQAGRVAPAALLAGCSLGAVCAAILVVNNLRDRHTDARVGKRTLAVRTGARATRRLYGGLLAAALGLPSVAVATGSVPPSWLLVWLAAPAAATLVRAVYRRDGAALNPLLGRTARLELLVALLLAVGALLGSAQ